MSTASQFYQILDRDSIYDTLFAYLSPASIFRTARTCHVAREASIDYQSRAFDIQRHLKRFFADPVGFRVLQAQTGAVISGSNALQFFDRDFYPDSDLDIFVHVGNALDVCTWIAQSAGRGYSFEPNEIQRAEGLFTYSDAIKIFGVHHNSVNLDWNRYEESAAYSVINFVSAAGFPGTRKVQVIATSSTPMANILRFHSTVVMNAITYRAAYSLFPLETFENRRLLFLRDERSALAVKKYYARGWEDVPLTESMPRYAFYRTCDIGKRWVEDNRTWIIPFDTTDIETRLAATGASQNLTSLNIDPFSLNSFSVTFTAPGAAMDRIPDYIMPGLARLSVDFDIVTSDFFEGAYTACPELALKMHSILWNLREIVEDEPMLSVNQSDAVFRIMNEICRRHCHCNLMVSRGRFTYDEQLHERKLLKCRAHAMLRCAAGLFLRVTAEECGVSRGEGLDSEEDDYFD